jgi:hypothetical protein
MAVVLMGPGSVGTGTSLGFSGLEAGEILNAAAALNGRPVIIPRISFADRRERHRGLSHHTLTVLRHIAQPGVTAALPKLGGEAGAHLSMQAEQAGLASRHRLEWRATSPVERMEEAFRSYPLPIRSMGRGLRDDPAYFAGIEAAVAAAWDCWK